MIDRLADHRMLGLGSTRRTNIKVVPSSLSLSFRTSSERPSSHSRSAPGALRGLLGPGMPGHDERIVTGAEMQLSRGLKLDEHG